MQQFVVQKSESGQTAVKYLQRLLKDAPNGLIYKQIRKKNITLNKKKMEGNEKLSEGDVISIFMSDETISKFTGTPAKDVTEYIKAYEKLGEPHIVYEDDHIILLNKPVGILSQKSTPQDLSANEWLIGYLLSQKAVSAETLVRFTPSVCNRLDRNTGGLLIFAKTLFGANIMGNLLKNRSLHKYYKTIVHGKIASKAHISGYLSKDEKTNKVSITKKPIIDADYIETAYLPLRYSDKNDLTELEVLLITGKPHQIRAHLSSIGHSIIGDSKYASKDDQTNNMNLHLKHQLLYAYKLVMPELIDYPELSNKTIEISFDNIFDKYFS